MASTPGFEPRPHWWEVGGLTTAPSLTHQVSHLVTQSSVTKDKKAMADPGQAKCKSFLSKGQVGIQAFNKPCHRPENPFLNYCK